MKASRLAAVRRLHDYKFWLFAIAVGLTAFQVILTWKVTGDTNNLSVSVLFWVALLYLIWKKRDTFNLESDIFSSLGGILLISLILIKTISLFWFESYFIKISALLSFIGLGLLASGLKGLKQYQQEFLILILLVISEGVIIELLEKLIDLSTLGAKLSTFVLWYLGFQVSRQGVNVILPTGIIEVQYGCSGLNAMLLLLRLAVLFIAVFPMQLYTRIIVPIVAVFLAFIINVFRLALMAVLVASSNQEAFHYWHGEEGAQVFSTISILLFGVLCRFLVRHKEA